MYILDGTLTALASLAQHHCDKADKTLVITPTKKGLLLEYGSSVLHRFEVSLNKDAADSMDVFWPVTGNVYSGVTLAEFESHLADRFINAVIPESFLK